MDSQIRVGTGVRVYFEIDAGFATGCVSDVTNFLDGFVSVLWHYWRMPGGSYKADEPELISKFFVEDLVVMSQPDHNYWLHHSTEALQFSSFVGVVGSGISGPLYGIYWVWDGGPLKPDRLFDWTKVDPEDLCVWWSEKELVVMSQPDHNYNPLREKSAGFMLWFRLERYDDFLARWQGAPANPWID
jgi:hypothetical protein